MADIYTLCMLDAYACTDIGAAWSLSEAIEAAQVARQATTIFIYDQIGLAATVTSRGDVQRY